MTLAEARFCKGCISPYTIWITEFFAIAGFSFVGPFVPYYIQELGVRDPKQVAMVGASIAASVGLRAPFILSAGILGLGTAVVLLWVQRESSHPRPNLG